LWVHNHRDGRTALENFLQAQPHEALTAQNCDCELYSGLKLSLRERYSRPRLGR
jgi:hypothetical protein